MSEGEHGDTENETPEQEAQAFYELANLFLAPANQLAGTADVSEIAAAFLYGCSRYNAFAMQAQAEDLADHRDEAADMLTGYWTTELRDHMKQSLQRSPAPPEPGVAPTDAVDVLKGLDARAEADFKSFMDMADQFINVANDAPTSKISRLSACCMHACARFNVFVMQVSGLAPGAVDEALVDAFSDAYRRLVEMHLKEMLVAPKP